jgi:spermidine synthase
MQQIIQTRILSVVAYYYLAFLTISMAMFGLTVGALIVYYGGPRFTHKSLPEDLRRACVYYALSTAICLALQLASVAVTVPTVTGVIIWLKIVLLLGAPFVFAGVAISLALTRSHRPIGIVYGVDMAGAASGCLGAALLLNITDAPSALLINAAVAGIAAFCFDASKTSTAPSHQQRYSLISTSPLTLAAVLAVLGALNMTSTRGLQPAFGKEGIELRDNFEHERWNSYSRVVAYRSRMEEPWLWGRSVTLPGQRVEQRLLNIDGSAATYIPRFNGDLSSVEFLRYDITNLAYYARNAGRAAVIGVGGGRDILSAHLFGFRDITGIEVNPIFIDFLTNPKRLRAYAGIADLPRSRLLVDDGRSWFARTHEKFDLIQMSMIDTWAATGAGAFALSENGLYTTEAWRLFLNALTPNGILTVSRWHTPGSPVETARVVSLAVSALIASHTDHPREHIYLASSSQLATLIVSKSALTSADVNTLNDTVDRLQFKTLIEPDKPASDPVLEFLLASQTLEELSHQANQYVLDVSAATDARPFFFNQLRLRTMSDVATILSIGSSPETYHVLGGNLLALSTLALLIWLSAVLVVWVIIRPAWIMGSTARDRFIWLASGYFGLIGAGFMFVEIGMMQRTSIFMGHPTYGLVIVLFSIILSTGIGAIISQRLPVWIVAPNALLLSLYLGAIPGWLPGMEEHFQSAEVLTRSAIAILSILPAGLMMGNAFPMGMRVVSTLGADRASPWYWGINGATGVLASGLAIACSITFSIDVTLWFGAGCYLAIGLLWLLMTNSRKASALNYGILNRVSS